MSTIYLKRDNKIKLRLQADGMTVPPGQVSKVVFFIPGDLTTDGEDIILDSALNNEVALRDSKTVVEITAGFLDLKRGSGTCYLTIYDVAHPNGLAWDTVQLVISDWQPAA